MALTKTTTCRNCGTEMDLTGHFGRPPVWCSQTCRSAGRIVGERARRAQHRDEVAQLRRLVASMSAALAA